MNQVPKASSGAETKKFWSKIKQSSKGLSSSLGNLSLHSEHDGSTETDTIIHKAMVNYYQANNLKFPEWLGVPERSAPSARQETNNYRPYQAAQRVPADQRSGSGSNSNSTVSSASMSSSSRRGAADSSKYSLSDIYSKSSTDLRSSSAANSPRAPLNRSQSNFSASSRADPSAAAGNTYSATRVNSTASNRLKERAQRQNKQSFESGSYAQTAPAGSSNTHTSSMATWRRN